MNSKLNMFIFDFDETLSVRSSAIPIEELAYDKQKLNLDDINNRYEKLHHCWNIRMNEVHECLAQQGIQTEQLIETFRTIELSPGVNELFYNIFINNGRIVVMSNACDLVIKECLHAQNLLQYVYKIESNPVRQIYPIIIIDEYEKPLQTICKICEPNLCKGSIIDKYRDKNKYDQIIFIGDGDNDVCAALHLNKNDIAFAKYDEKDNTKIYPILSSSSTITYRQFWNSLNIVWNKYDRKRVQEIGPDRACAEWLLRCGGSVRFKNWGTFISNNNALPTGAPGQFKIEEIRAIKACITSEGFAYLDGLTDLKKIHLEKCDQINDSSIARCNKIKDTLESITLIDLIQISENGLAYLAGLTNLKHIILTHLPSVKHREAVLKLLKNELPRCTINYDDKHPSSKELKEK
ncbi:unnamed protein product [Rotaria sordida]|uniref:Uncharacterized protein n=1 Tax=Rotaria sordida TaxID=392033 RepID=A0A815B3Y5_9BILA|nr:unnamed protein product [Rotaria sordida]